MLMEIEEAQLVEGASWHVGTWARRTRGSAKVQIGAELLCKSAKVILKG
jgi:hypothetical protein